MNDNNKTSFTQTADGNGTERKATVEDNAGNIGTCSKKVYKDTVPPNYPDIKLKVISDTDAIYPTHVRKYYNYDFVFRWQVISIGTPSDATSGPHHWLVITNPSYAYDGYIRGSPDTQTLVVPISDLYADKIFSFDMYDSGSSNFDLTVDFCLQISLVDYAGNQVGYVVGTGSTACNGYTPKSSGNLSIDW